MNMVLEHIRQLISLSLIPYVEQRNSLLLLHLEGSGFVREVSQAPSDVWVVVILYKDGFKRLTGRSDVAVSPRDYKFYAPRHKLQAQAAGVAYSHPMTNLTSRMAVFGPNMMFTDLRCSPSCTRAGVHGTVSICPPDCFEYKGTLDEGFGRLWRGTNAGLALAILTVGIYLPCYDIFRNWFEEFAAENAPSMTPYAPLLLLSFVPTRGRHSCGLVACSRSPFKIVDRPASSAVGNPAVLVQMLSYEIAKLFPSLFGQPSAILVPGLMKANSSRVRSGKESSSRKR
ncbi:unnamed protein product [Lactuca saligna]|uniref:Uncharacterized protein n=1 Tax=Lactuca saligna TaxID=75948 RepID=A0AA35ZCD6_LACSI|nr:unnamed protein product [Lactuca saligna]